jgi:hypothetical protein
MSGFFVGAKGSLIPESGNRKTRALRSSCSFGLTLPQLINERSEVNPVLPTAQKPDMRMSGFCVFSSGKSLLL